MRKLARLVGAVLLLGACLQMSGCWDMVEVSRASLMTGLALEPGHNGRILVTLEVLNSAETMSFEGGKGGSPSQLYSNEADTIVEAMIRMNEHLDRMLIPSHIRVIIVDERIAREGLDRFMDFVQRSRYVREDVTLLVSRGTKASDMLRVAYPDGMYAGFGIQSQVFNYHNNWGGVPDSFMYEVAQSAFSPGKELLLGAVTLDKKSDKEESVENSKKLDPQTLVRIAGSAAFRENRLIGFLSKEDTRMVLLVTNQLKRTTVSFPLDGQGKYAAIRLIRCHTSKKVQMIEGRPLISINVEAAGLVASMDDNLAIDKIHGYEQLDRLASEHLKESLTATIGKVQKQYKVDVFGFGEHLYRHRYHEFMPVSKEWNEQFAKAKVVVQVSVRIERSELKSRNQTQNKVVN
ncbi:Ger(x)C family spore germination protein [Cohnella thailandensis]|nr:Ger(x)C family spore germination protein [Cohnella thailandensis]